MTKVCRSDWKGENRSDNSGHWCKTHSLPLAHCAMGANREGLDEALLRIDQLEKLRRDYLTAASKRVAELERELEQERTKHTATLLQAIGALKRYDAAAAKVRSDMDQLCAEAGDIIVATKDRLQRFENLRPSMRRPMSHDRLCEHGYPSDGGPRSCGIDHEAPEHVADERKNEPPTVEAEEDLERHAARYGDEPSCDDVNRPAHR